MIHETSRDFEEAILIENVINSGGFFRRFAPSRDMSTLRLMSFEILNASSSLTVINSKNS